MKSNDILYSNGNRDEQKTPVYAIVPILKYIPKNAVVWCPFDTKDSYFVKLISIQNKVIFSHINNGEDFYTYEPKEHWDMMISNPPFTNKRKIFERAISFKKPFALLMTNVWLNDSAPVKLFSDIGLELLMFDKRIEYIQDETIKYDKKNVITFSSSYYCNGVLPQQIILESLNKSVIHI